MQIRIHSPDGNWQLNSGTLIATDSLTQIFFLLNISTGTRTGTLKSDWKVKTYTKSKNFSLNTLSM